MRSLLIAILLTASAAAQEPHYTYTPSGGWVPVKKAKPALTRTPSGYLWTFADAQAYKESFVEYQKRTGKLPPATQFSCSTAHCGTPASSPTVATGGCRCGCSAASCNCAHSPNVGKPLAAQLYQPGVRPNQARR